MDSEKEKTLEGLAGLFDSAWKIGAVIIVVLSGFASLVLGWVQIESNTSELQQLEIDRKEDQEIRDRRSDKRYERAMGIADDHERRLRDTEDELKEHLIEDAYHRGWTDAQIESLQDKKP